MAGGGKSGPTSSTVTQTNVPEWLRPQVETLVGGATKELFTTQRTPDGAYEITGVKPYTPYSTKPEEYVAGFSPLQEQAFAGTAGLQTPGQFGMGTQMSQQAGLGGLSTAQQAAGLSGMQAGAGNQYMQMATNPFATQAFMSPYMQNVVDVQQQQAQRQADIANQATRAKIAQSGGFGGRGAFLAPAQANADLMRQKQDIQARGLQSAFEQARQTQQFGADLNLRGLTGAQQGLQNVLGSYDLLNRSAGMMGDLGSRQLQAQKDIIGLQSQMGGMERQRQQDIINQAIQNFAMGQETPMTRLNQFNAILRGYATPGQTTTQYTAAPPMTSQLAGLGTAAYGASKLLAKGGKVQSMATGGIPEINRKVLFDPNSVSLQQVQQGIKNETISDLIGVPVALQKKKSAQQASAMQTPTNQATLTEEALAGIDSIPSNLPVRAASGGIIAFNGEEESLVPSTADTPKRGATLASVLAELRQSLGEDRVQSPEVAEYLKAARAAATSPEDIKRQQGMRILQAGLGIMGGRSPVAFQNIAEGIQPALKGYEEDVARQKAAGIASLKAQADIAEARRLERRGEVKDALGLLEKQKELEMRERVSKQHVLTEYAKNYLEMQKAKGDPRSDKEIMDEGYRVGFRQYGYAQGRAEAGLAGTALTTTTARDTAAGSQDLRRAELEQNARIAALGAWEKKEFTDPEKRQYRRIQRASGQEAADAYKDTWIKEQIAKSAPPVPPSPRPPAGQPAPGRQPSRPPSGNFPTPVQWQIDRLQENKDKKSYIEAFETKFGPGSSDKYLK